MTRALVVVAIVAGACGGDPAPDAPAKKPPAPPAPQKVGLSTKQQPMEHRAIHLDEPVVELPREDAYALVSPGAEPRAVLQYALAEASATYAAETRLESRHIADNAGWTKPVAMPTIHDGFTISALANGNLQLRPLPVELGGPATPDSDQYTAPWTQNLANHRANVTLDKAGRLGKLHFNDDPQGDKTADGKDELAQRLLATVVPLPKEPVGAGASWHVVTILREGHAYVKQSATYKLVGAPTGKTWTIEVDIKRMAEEQRVLDKRLPPGVDVDLLGMMHAIAGTLVVDPTRPLGTGKLAVSSTVHARLSGPAIAAPNGIDQIVEDTGSVTLTVK